MVASEKANTSQSSIDSILRGLTDRPNVESTLILSRKDGSIIKLAGALLAEQKRRIQSIAAHSAGDSRRMSPNAEAANPATGENGMVNEEERTLPSPAEELAGSIFQFVKSAAFLGTTLCSVAKHSEQEDGASFLRPQRGDDVGKDNSKTALDDTEDLLDESQVQLMRLRIKSREIIIFPDPQYLCCVVQRVGKQGHAVNSR